MEGGGSILHRAGSARMKWHDEVCYTGVLWPLIGGGSFPSVCTI